jgi:hypothetical protein
MRRTVILAVLCFAISRVASAAPITLTYAGTWIIFNPIPVGELDVAVQTGFGAYGINQGSPLLFSMTINPNATAVPVGGGLSVYPNGLSGATLRVGPLTYTATQSFLGINGGPDFLHMAGPVVVGSNGLALTKLELLSQFVGGPMFQFGNVPVFPFHRLQLFFNEVYVDAPVISDLQLVSVSVPEPSTLVTLSGAAMPLLAMWGWRRRRRN